METVMQLFETFIEDVSFPIETFFAVSLPLLEQFVLRRFFHPGKHIEM